jgi:hypothetical protein
MFAAEELRLSLDGLPNFVFADDRVSLFVDVSINRERPGNEKKAEENLSAQVSAGKLGQATVAVPPYSDRSAQAYFLLNFSQVSPGEELAFEVTATGAKSASAGAVIYDICHAPKNLRLALDHFVDGKGHRVIFRIPRPDESRSRRWAPLKSLENIFAETSKRKLLLVGDSLGGGIYAENLRKIAAEKFSEFRSTLCDKSPTPVFSLLQKAMTSENEGGAVVVVPGTEDVSVGTPLEEYYLALHALAAVYDSRENPPKKIVLATPPLYAADPAKGNAYAGIAKKVAAERFLVCADLSDIGGATDGATLIEAYPDQQAQEKIAGKLLQAATGGNGNPFGLILPTAMFLLCSLALLWLWIKARHRLPPVAGS